MFSNNAATVLASISSTLVAMFPNDNVKLDMFDDSFHVKVNRGEHSVSVWVCERLGTDIEDEFGNVFVPVKFSYNVETTTFGNNPPALAFPRAALLKDVAEATMLVQEEFERTGVFKLVKTVEQIQAEEFTARQDALQAAVLKVMISTSARRHLRVNKSKPVLDANLDEVPEGMFDAEVEGKTFRLTHTFEGTQLLRLV